MTSHKYIKKLLIIHILLATLILSGCGDDLTDIEYVQRAKDYQDAGDLISAVIELKNAASKNPENPEARLILGQIYLNVGNGPAAEKELALALKLGVSDLNTKLDLFESYLLQRKFQKIVKDLRLAQFTINEAMRSRAYQIKGNAFLGKNDTKQAKSLLEKSIKVEDNPLARVGLIKIFLLENNLEPAHAAIKDAMGLFPKDFELLLVAADYYRHVKNYDQAIDLYTQSLAIKSHLNALLMRADLYVIKNKLELAEQDVSSALAIKENYPIANFVKGKISYGQKNFEDAQQYLEKVVRALPDQFSAIALLGVVNFRLGNLEQTVNYLEKYQNNLPGNADVERLLAEAYIKLGRGEEAIRLLEKLKADGASDPGLHLLLGGAYIQSNDISKAKDNLSSAKNLSVTKQGAKELAILKILTGDNSDAIKDLEEVLAGERQNKQAEILLVWALLRSGEDQKAYDFAHAGVLKEPKDPLRLFVRGLVNQHSNRVNVAISDYNAALREKADFVLAIYSLAEIFYHKKNYKEALNKFNQVLKVKPNHFMSLMGIALVEKELGNVEKYKKSLQAAITSNSQAWQPVNAIMDLYIQNSEFEKADDVVANFQSKNPDSEYGFFMRAKTFLSNGKYEDAEYELRRYLKVQPSNNAVRVSLIELLLKQSNVSAALAESENLVMKDNSPSLLAVKVRLFIRANELNQAEKLNAAIKEMNSSGSMNLYHELSGDILVKRNNVEEAIRSYEAALKLKRSSRVLQKIVKLDLYLKNFDMARERMVKHLVVSTNDFEVRLMLASLYVFQQQSRLAEAEYQKILNIQPDHVVALNNLALFYAENGKLKRALALAGKAYKAYPTAEIMDTYGWLLVQNGNHAEGLPLLGRAYKRLPGNDEIAFHYIIALREIGKEDEANIVKKTISAQKYIELLK